jgi:hypothetical protein
VACAELVRHETRRRPELDIESRETLSKGPQLQGGHRVRHAASGSKEYRSTMTPGGQSANSRSAAVFLFSLIAGQKDEVESMLAAHMAVTNIALLELFAPHTRGQLRSAQGGACRIEVEPAASSDITGKGLRFAAEHGLDDPFGRPEAPPEVDPVSCTPICLRSPRKKPSP